MGIMAKMRDLDARGGSILPGSAEPRSEYLVRVASSGRGVVGAGMAVLARELLDQRERVALLEARLARLEAER